MYKTISEIRARNRAAGFHFFDRKTMRYFRSKIYPYVYGGRYFVTRETDPDGKTGYTVRQAGADGRIKPGQYMVHATLDDARTAAKHLARGL
ncbi:MAG: DUF7447 family protein [Sulfobacillus sp.]